jgi:Spy/CpxP family protein refolding chaperone
MIESATSQVVVGTLNSSSHLGSIVSESINLTVYGVGCCVQLAVAANQLSIGYQTSVTSTYTLSTFTTSVTYLTTDTGGTTFQLLDTDSFASDELPRVVASTTNLSVTTSYALQSELEVARTGPFMSSRQRIFLRQRDLTDEEKARREARREEYERQRREDEAKRKVADSKADVLLRKVLTAKQRAELDEFGHFYVWGRDGSKYRISRGRFFNVEKVCAETGKFEESYCIHPSTFVPVSDVMLAQKLFLEGHIERFLQTANVRDR